MKLLQFLNCVVVACGNLFFTHDFASLGEIARRGAPVGVLRFLLGGARACDFRIFRLLSLQFLSPVHGHVPELLPFALNEKCATIFNILVSQTCSVEQLWQKMDKEPKCRTFLRAVRKERAQRQSQFSSIANRAMQVACRQRSWQMVIAQRKESIIL